jgi:ribosome-associated protein
MASDRSKKLKPRKAVTKKPVKKAVRKGVAEKAVKRPAKKLVKKSARKGVLQKSRSKTVAPVATPSELLTRVLSSLEDDKAERVTTIDMQGRSSLADCVVIASGRSSRHVAAIAEHLARRLKESGYGTRPVNGAAQGDWVLVDAGDVIVHVFRPEVREYYDLEGMWSVQNARPGR